jgi:tape measure domain-containing protein
MADLNIQLILKLVDRATAPARAAMRLIDRMGGEGMRRHAERVNRGATMMASGLGSVTGAALSGTAVLAGYAGTMGLITSAFIGPAAEMERFKVQLKNLEGSSEGAEKAMKWIQDFATTTPLELNDTISAYARLKAFGVDPTNGSLQALVDTMAATGGGAEQLDGLVMALGQSWTKGKLQSEEALQMLERGVPVWDLLAEKLGKTSVEVQEMASKGKLGRKEIGLLVEALGERNKGASENMSKTWDGIISNIMDHWSRFRVMVMDSGVFDFLKGRMQQLLDLLNQMAADGRLQVYADRLAQVILTSLEAMWAFGQGVYRVWNTLFPILSRTAELLGGWDNLAWFAAAILMRGTLFGLIGGFWKLGRGAALVAWGLFGMAGEATAATSVLTRIGILMRGGLARGWALMKAGAGHAALAIRWVSKALLAAGRAALANPILLVIAAIAGAAYVIYQNWDGIVAYFQGKIDRVRAAFDQGLLNGVFKLISEFNPFVLIMDAAMGLFTYLTGWTFDDVREAIADAFGFDPFTAIQNAALRFWNYLTSWDFARIAQDLVDAFLAIDWVQIGIDMMNAIWSGMKSIAGNIGSWMKAQATSWMPDWLTGAGSAGSIGGGGSDGMGGAMDGNPAVLGDRALGGPVRAGRAYHWQEEGEEYFVPRTDGMVISNRQLRAMRNAGGARGGSFSIGGITINASPGMSPADVGREVVRQLQKAARERGFALNDGADYA